MPASKWGHDTDIRPAVVMPASAKRPLRKWTGGGSHGEGNKPPDVLRYQMDVVTSSVNTLLWTLSARCEFLRVSALRKMPSLKKQRKSFYFIEKHLEIMETAMEINGKRWDAAKLILKRLKDNESKRKLCKSLLKQYKHCAINRNRWKSLRNCTKSCKQKTTL